MSTPPCWAASILTCRAICEPNIRICTHHFLIGVGPMSAPNGGSARSYQELFVPFAVLTALAGHVVSPYIYAVSGLARTSASAGAGACCPEPERTAALPDPVSCNGVVATVDGLRSGEHLSELPGQAPMFLCCPAVQAGGSRRAR